MSFNTRRVYPVYVQPPIEVVVDKDSKGLYHYESKVSQLAESKLTQALGDFVEEISTAFHTLPTTVHDIEKDQKPFPSKIKPIAQDNLSLAEMGLSGFKGNSTCKKHSSTKIVPDPLPAYISMV
jgi:hypothetical protein